MFTLLSWLAFFFHLVLCASGYYQHPEVVEFTAVPGDAVVCGGCTLEMSCSILRQETAANLPQPELEWIFNGSRLTELEVFPGARVQTLLTTTHVSLILTIENAIAAEHSGTYQCRATDGNSPDHCGAAGASSIPACVPTTTISKPARIQIVDDAVSAEPVSVGSSCSGGVALLPCGGRLMQQGTALRETLNLHLTWRRNGEELTPDSYSDLELVILSNGDLVMNATSSDNVGLYECVAVFSTAGYRNVTLARYSVTSLEPQSSGSGSSLWTEDIMAGSTPTDYLKLTSSRAVLVEGGSVEFVCEASVSWVEGEEVEGEREEGSGGHGQYEPYTVTWSVRSSSGSGSDGALLQPMVDSTDTSFPSSITQLLNNHILRVGGVSSGSTQYCCEVYAGQRIGQECTTIHVVPQRAPPVDSGTIFLGDGGELDTAELSCSAPYAFAHQHLELYTWYHNGIIIENHTSSSLTVNKNAPNVSGVYQCFSAIQPHVIDEISITRVLPYGLTNPPGNISHPEEVPYPVDSPWYAKYRLNWTAPLFTGGLSSLHYNVTVSPLWFPDDEYSQSSNTTSVVIQVDPDYPVNISVAVINPTINSSDWKKHPHIRRYFQYLTSNCQNKVLHPPSPYVDCGHGLVTLFWQLSGLNDPFRTSERIEHVYAIGYCTLTNGSVYYPFNHVGDLPVNIHKEGETYSRSFDEATFEVGSQCQFSMASVNEDDGSFCFDPEKIEYSEPTTCVVQGYAEFANATIQVYENESSIEVCVRARGYGFMVNVSTAELTATAGYIYAPLINNQVYFSSLDQQFCLNITLMDNNVVEERMVQTFTIELSTDNHLVNISHPAVVMIIDDDYTAATVEFTHSSYNVSETEGMLQICASINVEVEVNVSVNIQSEDITAQGDNDYADVNQTLLFTPGGEMILCIDVLIDDDTIYEQSEVFFLSLNPLESAHIQLTNSTILVEILDDEVPGVEFSQPSYTVSELQGWIQVCATFDKELEAEFSAVITSQDNTATGDDYVSVEEMLIFAPGREPVECLNVTIINDDIFETSESFVLSLDVKHESVPVNATVYINIIDDEYVRVKFDPSSYTITEGEGQLEICAAIDKELGITVDVALSSQDDSAKGDDDYEVVNKYFTFGPGGDSVQCLNISIIDDEQLENTETFTLLLSTSADYNSLVLIDKSATVSILDNDKQTITDDNLVAVAMGIVFFLLVLVMAGSISCLVMVLLKRQRKGDWSEKQHWETKVEDFDVDFEPPIIIGGDITSLSETKKVHDYEDSFDSQTLLNYLLTRSPSSTDLNTAVAVPAVHKIQPLNQDYPHTDLSSSTNPIKEHHIKSDIHPVNGYNLSVESGVVMDADHEHFSRKVSDGSNNLSQGSHSYIDIGRSTMTCSCSECKVHRERTRYSLQAYYANKESSTAEHS